MIEETRLEDASLELEGGIEGASQMGVLLLNQDENGRIELSPRAQYDLLEFLYQRRYALYCATHLSLGVHDAPGWIQSGYSATRIIDAEETEE
ncbi:MAG: hypothetical protein ACYDER_07720 [Ktedonobacteraceae bacterium]